MGKELTEDQIQEILRRAPIGPRIHTGPASSDPVDMYLWEVGKYPTMASTEEQRTLALAAEGDVSAEKQLYDALLVFTAEIALQARPQWMEPVDAIVWANVALLSTIRALPTGDLHAAIRHAIQQNLESAQPE